MSNIQNLLQQILHAVYGKDVRQSIHDAIHTCYEDGKAGAVDLTARESLDGKADKTALAAQKNRIDALISGSASQMKIETFVEETDTWQNSSSPAYAYAVIEAEVDEGAEVLEAGACLKGMEPQVYKTGRVEISRDDAEHVRFIVKWADLQYDLHEEPDDWSHVSVSGTLSVQYTVASPVNSAPDSELTDARIGADGTMYTTAGTAVRTQVSDISEGTKNLFNKANTILGYISGATQPIKVDANNRNVIAFIPCEPETTYTIQRIAGGGRFRAADFSTDSVPAVGDYPASYATWSNNSVTGTFTTGANAKWFCVWVWAGAYASVTEQEMLDSIQIERGTEATEYTAHTTAVDRVARKGIQALSGMSFTRFGVLADGTDLNDLHGINGYYTAAEASSFEHQPMAGGRRTLLIFQTSGETQYSVQLMFDSVSGRFFTRAYVSNVWQEWTEVDPDAFSKDILGSYTGRYAFSHGGCYTVSAYEDSPRAFRDARRKGIVYQDLDVVFTSDLVPVVSHNAYRTNLAGEGFWFKNKTLAEVKQMSFGDENYSYTLQTMRECNELLRDIGGYPCIDIHGSSNNPAGAVEAFPGYLKIHHIRPVYLCTSDVETFSKLAANGGTEFPLGIVITAQNDPEFDDKIQLIMSTVTENNMDHGWLFVPYWGDGTFDSLMSPYLQDLADNRIRIVKYGLSSESQFAYEIPSCVDGVCSALYNVNYETYIRNR